jgi:hypothetical protein
MSNFQRSAELKLNNIRDILNGNQIFFNHKGRREGAKDAKEEMYTEKTGNLPPFRGAGGHLRAEGGISQ